MVKYSTQVKGDREMSFLSLDNGIVVCSEEGMTIPVVMLLYNTDKSKEKKFFRDSICYLYWVYNREGLYKDLFEGARKDLVMMRYLSGYKLIDFDGNNRVQAVKDEYLERQMTKHERFLYRLENDMEGLLNRITSIPYIKNIKTKVPHVLDNGDEIMVKVSLEIDNSKEKQEAIKLADTMIDYAEKLRNKILKEKIDKRTGGTLQRLFENKDLAV